jgi:hypothetical protein
MNELVLANRAADWRRLKMLVLDSVSSPITKRVYNLGLDEFFEWFGREPRLGFTKATVSAWRVALEARRLGAISINVRITAVRKLAVEAADKRAAGAGAGRWHHAHKGCEIQGVRVGNWLSTQALNHVKEEFELAQLRYMRILSDATDKSILDSKELLDLAQAGREYSQTIGQCLNELMLWLAFVDRTASSTPPQGPPLEQ